MHCPHLTLTANDEVMHLDTAAGEAGIPEGDHEPGHATGIREGSHRQARQTPQQWEDAWPGYPTATPTGKKLPPSPLNCPAGPSCTHFL